MAQRFVRGKKIRTKMKFDDGEYTLAYQGADTDLFEQAKQGFEIRNYKTRVMRKPGSQIRYLYVIEG